MKTLRETFHGNGSTMRLVIGCRNEDPQAKPEDKWYFPHDTQTRKPTPECVALYYLDFAINYHVGGIDPEWRWWVKYGFVVEGNVYRPFVTLLNDYSQEDIVEFMKRCMTRRQVTLKLATAPKDKPGPNERPMPGAGKPNPTIKDIKGERLS